MKTLLIMTGPQGSGNHMWSKIFALHPEVHGWRALLDQYWIGHDQEPFAKYWANPDLLESFEWQHRYYVTSISVPYMNNGTATKPNIVRFAACAMGAGLRVKIAILGRDRNIVDYQQIRVRGASTHEQALAEYQKLTSWQPTYLSYELLYMYGSDYLRRLSDQLEFPIAYNDPRLKEIMAEDTNSKYFTAIDYHPTDDLARYASRKHR